MPWAWQACKCLLCNKLGLKYVSRPTGPISERRSANNIGIKIFPANPIVPRGTGTLGKRSALAGRQAISEQHLRVLVSTNNHQEGVSNPRLVYPDLNPSSLELCAYAVALVLASVVQPSPCLDPMREAVPCHCHPRVRQSGFAGTTTATRWQKKALWCFLRRRD